MRPFILAAAIALSATAASADSFSLIIGLESGGGDIHDYILDSGLSGADCGARVQALESILPGAIFDCLPDTGE